MSLNEKLVLGESLIGKGFLFYGSHAPNELEDSRVRGCSNPAPIPLNQGCIGTSQDLGAQCPSATQGQTVLEK